MDEINAYTKAITLYKYYKFWKCPLGGRKNIGDSAGNTGGDTTSIKWFYYSSGLLIL